MPQAARRLHWGLLSIHTHHNLVLDVPSTHPILALFAMPQGCGRQPGSQSLHTDPQQYRVQLGSVPLFDDNTKRAPLEIPSGE